MLSYEQDYLLRWVHAKSNHVITWIVQPHKRSINFGLFKHPGALVGLTTLSTILPHALDHDNDESTSELVQKLGHVGLKQVVKLAKYEADKFSQGQYEVPNGDGGHYALVFDNTFSKSTAKSVTFCLITYPTSTQQHISFGAQAHHSQAAALQSPAPVTIAPGASSKSAAKAQRSVDSLNTTENPRLQASSLKIADTGLAHTGILLKRRRKKRQGYAKRFFCLDLTSATLVYYHDRNSSALRGAIPLSLAAIGANAKTREISIDSGAEVWHLKSNNQADFNSWKFALERASQRLMITGPHKLEIDTSVTNDDDDDDKTDDDRRWQRAETLLGEIMSIRDKVRKLDVDTQSSACLPHSPFVGGPSPATNENGPDDYFGEGQKRAFWKRKSSHHGPSNFKRSASMQAATPTPGAGLMSRDNSLHENVGAIEVSLENVIVEFSALMQEWKRRSAVPTSAISRLSIESQEYFDAEDINALRRNDTQLLDIASEESEPEGSASGTESDVDETASNIRFRSGSLSCFIPPKAKSLTPLPVGSVERRRSVASPTIPPPSLIGFLRKNVGKDLSTISMPVSANEPVSLLQKATENLEYSELLDTAAKLDSIEQRLAHVTAFAISSYSSSRIKERSIRKPFNPMLGETYELVREDKYFRFVAEKVSHRPVQLAFHAEGRDWSFTQSPKPSQKFWGKSSEIITEGKARVMLYPTGECYSWSAANCFLRNIIAGEKYIEPVGTMDIVCDTTGHRSIITFKAKGMFGGRSEEVDIKSYDASGGELDTSMTGAWTKSLTTKSGTQIWTVGALVDQPEKHYGMTLFAASLNEITSLERGKLPPTDSRLRVDQRALEEGRYDDAERLKNEVEEAQRRRRRRMEDEGVEWTPKFFSRVADGDQVAWKLKNGEAGYWERRARSDWSGVVDVLSLI